ncbi:hypothetical protein BDF14DRAFT_46584 [Spinellus fusiger]|nr:hypothetical protein BDF14DRAFT_46584 [Spinellus fusiger]
MINKQLLYCSYTYCWKIGITTRVMYSLYTFFFSSCQPKQPDVLSHVFSLKLPPDPFNIRSSQIIGSVLSELWRAHWRLLFDDIPFSSSTIISSSFLQLILSFSEKETLLAKCI